MILTLFLRSYYNTFSSKPSRLSETVSRHIENVAVDDTPIAGVVKLVDALDSKSSGPCVRVGSIPTSGTTNHAVLEASNAPNTFCTRLLRVRHLQNAPFRSPRRRPDFCACPACPVEYEVHSSGVAPEDGTGVRLNRAMAELILEIPNVSRPYFSHLRGGVFCLKGFPCPG